MSASVPGVGPGRDRLVPGGVEPGAAVVAAREAQAGQHAEGLLPDRLDPVDNGGRVGRGVRQREIEAVDHGQPLPGHGSPGLLLGAADLRGTSLAHVVEISQGAQARILEFRDPGRLVVDRVGGAWPPGGVVSAPAASCEPAGGAAACGARPAPPSPAVPFPGVWFTGTLTR